MSEAFYQENFLLWELVNPFSHSDPAASLMGRKDTGRAAGAEGEQAGEAPQQLPGQTGKRDLNKQSEQKQMPFT